MTPLQRRALAALADELSSRPPAPGVNPSVVARPLPTEPHHEFQPESQLDVPIEPRIESRPEPQIVPPLPVAAEPTSAADETLPEMAHRLRAALRQPTNLTVPERAPAAEAAPPSRAPARPPPSPERLRAGAGPSQTERVHDSLTQEVARLLGRVSKN